MHACECVCFVCVCVCAASGVIQTGADEKKSTNKVKNPLKVRKASDGCRQPLN